MPESEKYCLLLLFQNSFSSRLLDSQETYVKYVIFHKELVNLIVCKKKKENIFKEKNINSTLQKQNHLFNTITHFTSTEYSNNQVLKCLTLHPC